MEVGLKKLRKFGDSYLETLNCFKCNKKIVNFIGFDDFCEKCFKSSKEEVDLNLYCEKCRIKCKRCNGEVENRSIKLEIVSQFFIVHCEKHQDIIATKVLDPYFITVCNECLKTSGGTAKAIKYKKIENVFFELFSASSSKLLSDRKELLISKDLKGLLKATRWLYMLANGFPCINHNYTPGKYINKKFEVLCSKCKKDPEAHSLNTVSKTALFLQNCLRDALNQPDPSKLNKYLLNQMKISARPIINSAFDLNLLILEGKDFFQNIYTYRVRCVYCYSKLSVEYKKGIKLNCKHSVCFKCIFHSNIQSCPIDNIPIEFKHYQDYKFNLPTCHQMHSFLITDKIFKLPCQHFTCESHLSTGYCFLCGFDMDFCGLKPKISNNVQELIKLCKPQCSIHNKPYEYFYLMQIIFLCEDCLINKNKKFLFKFNSDHTNFISNLFEHLYHKLIDKVKEKSSLSVTFLKIFSHIGIKGFSFKLNFLTCIRLLYSDPSLKYEKFLCKELRIFNKTSFPYKIPLKGSKNIEFTFTLTPYEDLIVNGVLLNRSFYELTLMEFSNLIESYEIKVFNSERIEYKDLQITMDGVKYEECKDHDAVLALSRPFIARMGLIYVFIFQIKPEFVYFRSISSSKLKSELFRIGSFWQVSNTNDIIDGNLGGLLYGLFAESLYSFL